MKKVTKTLVAAFIAALTAMSFVACTDSKASDSTPHEHTYATEWTTSNTEHWHAATCSENDECQTAMKDKAAHADADKDGKCDVCEYVMNVTLTGSGTTLGADGATVQPTGATLKLDFTTNKAKVYLTTTTMNMDFFLVSSEAGAEGNFLYAMCQVVGDGDIATTETGYKATFNYEVSYTDEQTGEAKVASMTLDIPVTVANGVYTAKVSYSGIEVDTDSLVKLNGSGTTPGQGEGAAPVPTKGLLKLDFANMEATLDVTMTVNIGFDADFYVLSEAVSTDASLAMFYSMCQPIGKGTITKTESGYKVTFNYEVSYTDEQTGESKVAPMTLEIPVTVAEGGYSATLTYGTINLTLA